MPGGHDRVRRGKAPPVDTFTGMDPESRIEDWLPTLKMVANWNGWTEDDLLLQLAGHMKGRALQEWNLVLDDQKTTYHCALQREIGPWKPGDGGAGLPSCSTGKWGEG